MAIDEMGKKYFSRERIRNRMLKRAAEVWGFSESEMDDFDPLVILLIEACSVEFEKVAGEIGKTQNRMLERLAQLLYPGMIDVNPAYGIIQARSSEPSTVVYRDGQFVHRPTGNDRKRENQTIDLFFSPCRPSRIVDGTVKYMGTGRELFQIEDGMQKMQVASSSKKILEWQHSVWLGLELHEELESLEGVSFFFNWVNQPESDNWYNYIPYTHWLLNQKSLDHTPGFPADEEILEAEGSLDNEYDAIQGIENQVIELFNRNYITITSKHRFEDLKALPRPYPAAFEQIFDKKELKPLTSPLQWVEIRFPAIIPGDALDSLWCSINAIPVLNRKLNKFSYKLVQSLNIVPLETEGTFLAMKEITNSQGNAVKLVPFANSAVLQPETYILRYGVNRFDERNSYETLVNLTELIKEESSFFSSLGEDFLIENIRELNQILARLEEKVKIQNRNESPFPYLIIKPQREGANIMIEFWSCNGEKANRIPIGSRLISYRNSNVRSNSLFFISSTYGGRDKFSDAEKIGQYKKSLLTHNRIVTLEDLKTVTRSELGKTAEAISFEKSYMKGDKPGQGFMRCMQIIVTPASGSMDPVEWDQRLRELQLKLEKMSANNIPYHIKLASS